MTPLKSFDALFIGIPAWLICMTLGVLACLTIIGIPIGLTLFALGFKLLG